MAKFVRGLIFTDGIVTGGNNGASPLFALKFMYEFWGFCLHTPSSLTVPGGFAATTPSNFPANFLSIGTTIAAGSNGATLPQATLNVASTTGFPTSGTLTVIASGIPVTVTYTGTTGTTFTGCTGGTGTLATGNNVSVPSLMAFGSDGYTNPTTIFRYDGYTEFNAASSVHFTPAMIGKHLVVWKPGSTSSEDSIYPIIGLKSSSTLIININTGGVPSAPDGYKPSVTSRSSINYRVVDMGGAGKTSGATTDNNYLVFQVDPTGVNAGQNNSQFQLLISGGGVPASTFSLKYSPAGTWNGSVFSDGTATYVGGGMTNAGASSGTMSINLIGDKSFLICHSKDTGNPNSNGWFTHWEVPERLYAQAQDQNPFTWILNGYNSPQFHSTSSSVGYGGGWAMRCADGLVRNYRALAKASTGDGNGWNGIAQIFGNQLSDLRVISRPITGSVLSSGGILCLPGVAGQFSLARARIRNIRFTNTLLPLYHRLEANGDWIQVGSGVALPWDKTVLPFPLFPF